uniref:Uncharacterized protein n=1 Tax=Rhipicephalus microplus TaxID=6941 RepID=A0A6G5AI96_RHIMP
MTKHDRSLLLWFLCTLVRIPCNVCRLWSVAPTRARTLVRKVHTGQMPILVYVGYWPLAFCLLCDVQQPALAVLKKRRRRALYERGHTRKWQLRAPLLSSPYHG